MKAPESTHLSEIEQRELPLVLPMANARMNGRRRPHRHLHVSLHMPMIGCRQKPRIGLMSQAIEKSLDDKRQADVLLRQNPGVTYDSGTRRAVRIGTVKAVSTAYMNSMAKAKQTSRRITQRLFVGG